jgi:PAS domain S-box-containing protein
MTSEAFSQSWFAATEENFRILLDSAPDAILGIDESGLIVLANAQAEIVFGYSRSELLGQRIETLVPERFRPGHTGHRASYHAAPRTRPMAKGMELWARRKDGTEFPAEIALSPMRTERGTVVSCIVRDVTDRFEAEKARLELVREQSKRAEAEQATRRFHDMVQTLDAIVWEYDPAAQRFTFVTRRGEELLGYAPADWYAEDNFLVRHAHVDDRPAVEAFFANVKRRDNAEVEFRVIAVAGQVFWFRTIVQVAKDAAGTPQIRGLMVDTTARRMSEQALRNSEKLAATGRLAATIAHEINNPMAAVTNVLYLLASHPTLDETAKQYTKMAQDEMSRVAQITRQMLRFYRDSSTRAPVNLPELLDNTVQLFARKIHDKRIKLEKRYEDCLGIFGFPGELRQVFSNLLINAVDATPTGGRIAIHVVTARQWKHRGRDGVRITVCDNGSGIERADLPKIFEPFFTTKQQHGTGLGLWVSYGIVQKHQGDIRVRTSTRPGRSGTCFSVFLPEAEDEAFRTPGRAD